MSLVKQRDVEAAKKKMDKKSAKTNKKRRKYKKSDKILSSMIKELIAVEKSVVEEGKYRIKMKFKTGEIDWVESSAVHHKAKTTKMFNAFVEKITQGQFKSWGKFEEKLQQVPMMQAGLNIQFQFAKDEVPEQHLFTFMYRYKEGLPPGYLADICWDKCDNPSYDVCFPYLVYIFLFFIWILLLDNIDFSIRKHCVSMYGEREKDWMGICSS